LNNAHNVVITGYNDTNRDGVVDTYIYVDPTDPKAYLGAKYDDFWDFFIIKKGN
jgi:hypothetical protein